MSEINATKFIESKKKDVKWLNEMEPGMYSDIVLMLYQFAVNIATESNSNLVSDNTALRSRIEELEKSNATLREALEKIVELFDDTEISGISAFRQAKSIAKEALKGETK